MEALHRLPHCGDHLSWLLNAFLEGHQSLSSKSVIYRTIVPAGPLLHLKPLMGSALIQLDH